MITKFMLNPRLYHVCMSWIISSNKEMNYELDGNNLQYWLNKGTRYNTYICLKSHGIIFEDFKTHARTERYNLMCYLVAHDKMQPDNEDDEISIGDRSILEYATTKLLKTLGATINFIDIWIKLFFDNYYAICYAYVNAMKHIFKQIPLTMSK